MTKQDPLVEVVAEAFLENMRGRRFLKYLFMREPDGAGEYGYIEKPLDAEVQTEIAESISTAALAASRPAIEREALEKAAKVAENRADLAREIVPRDLQQANTASQIATAIRKLIP